MRASNLMGAGISALTAQAITGGGDVDLAVTALGSGQTDAYAIKGTLTKITAGASTTGATLPSSPDVGDSFMVANYSGSAKTIYPPTGGKINNGSANGGVTLSDKDAIILIALSATDYAAMIIGVTESTFLSGVTAGTVAASKAVVVDANKDASSLRNLTATNLKAGASGTAGTIDVFPATASKGKIELVAANSAGDTITTITNASQAAARSYTVPDAGADASFVMSQGTQTINGSKTMSALILPVADPHVAGALWNSTGNITISSG